MGSDRKYLVTAMTCPRCHCRTYDLAGARELADEVVFSVAIEGGSPETTPHACRADQPSQARPDATTSGGDWKAGSAGEVHLGL